MARLCYLHSIDASYDVFPLAGRPSVKSTQDSNGIECHDIILGTGADIEDDIGATPMIGTDAQYDTIFTPRFRT